MSDDLLASDAEREQAVARLREASAEGRLTLEELGARTGAAYSARTHGELVKVTEGLPAARTDHAPEQRTGDRTRFVVGIFAPVRRRNRWRLGRRTIVLSLFAPTFFELGSANLESDEATITIFSVFAPVNVTAPEHVDLETSVFSLFAPVHEQGSPGDMPAAAPRIRVNGLAVFAPVFVRYRRS